MLGEYFDALKSYFLNSSFNPKPYAKISQTCLRCCISVKINCFFFFFKKKVFKPKLSNWCYWIRKTFIPIEGEIQINPNGYLQCIKCLIANQSIKLEFDQKRSVGVFSGV